jgi:cyclopentanol dehydrogenase
MRLLGKVALITGGAKGMGAIEAQLFAQEGAKVVIGDVLEQEGIEVAKQINSFQGECIFTYLDVTNPVDWEHAVRLTVDSFGSVDVLVNNAGVLIREELDNVTLEGWDKVLDVNAKGVLWGCKFVVPEMRKKGGGSIVNISSISGIVGLGYPAYNASKGAVRSMTKNLACLQASDNIRVNSIHPGIIRTDMMKNDLHSQKEWENSIPLGRLGESIEVAYGALYLASDESSFVTGSELIIDGGWTAQ